MQWDGFLTGCTCKRCGRQLQGLGDGRPAESYAGTYTGLCYDCERQGERLLRTAFDGCATWEFPPHCPAWRRDREQFKGYAGCPVCRGKGRLMRYQEPRFGGSYSTNCEPCSKRYYAHPRRRGWERRLKQLKTAAENRFRWLVAGMPEADVAVYRALLLARYNSRAERWRAYGERARLW